MRVERVIVHPILTKQVWIVGALFFIALALVFRAARKLALKRI